MHMYAYGSRPGIPFSCRAKGRAASQLLCHQWLFEFLIFVDCCVGGCVILSSSFCSVRLAQDIRIQTKTGPGLEREFKFYGLFCIALPALDRTSSSENGVRLRGGLLSSVL